MADCTYTLSMYLVVLYTKLCKSMGSWVKWQSEVIPYRYYLGWLICMQKSQFIGTSMKQIFLLTLIGGVKLADFGMAKHKRRRALQCLDAITQRVSLGCKLTNIKSSQYSLFLS